MQFRKSNDHIYQKNRRIVSAYEITVYYRLKYPKYFIIFEDLKSIFRIYYMGYIMNTIHKRVQIYKVSGIFANYNIWIF